MFADADDLLMPRAVEVLYRSVVSGGYDILRSHFIREQNNSNDLLLRAKDSTITWFHGKIYRSSYLKNLGARMPEYLRTDEDAYFNLIAWYGTKQRGFVDEITYIWRDNKHSITRKESPADYFIKTNHLYIRSQVEALSFIFSHGIELDDKVVTFTLCNIYGYYMHAKYYNCDINYLDSLISQLREYPQMQEWFKKTENWLDVLQTLKAGEQYEDGTIVFFQESFNLWAARLMWKGV